MMTKSSTNFISRRTGWVSLLVIALVAFVIVFLPAWIIQPFKPQTTRGLEISFTLRRWSPLVTLIALAAALLLVGLLGRGSRWWSKGLLVLIMLPLLASTWFARQNHFEWMFNPLATAHMQNRAEATFVGDNDMVLAVGNNGEAVAYPVRLDGLSSPGAGHGRWHSDRRYLLNALSHRSGVGNDSRRASSSLSSSGDQ